MTAARYPRLDGTQPCATAADPDIFFSPDPRDVRQALDLCAGCPFREPCAAFAVTHRVYGTWGGLTAPTRHEIQRKHGIEPHELELSDTHTRIEEVHRLTANGLSADEIAERLDLAKRSIPRTRSRSA